jgi:hypothetical protein
MGNPNLYKLASISRFPKAKKSISRFPLCMYPIHLYEGGVVLERRGPGHGVFNRGTRCAVPAHHHTFFFKNQRFFFNLMFPTRKTPRRTST